MERWGTLNGKIFIASIDIYRTSIVYGNIYRLLNGKIFIASMYRINMIVNAIHSLFSHDSIYRTS
jgi:hypothetical protein